MKAIRFMEPEVIEYSAVRNARDPKDNEVLGADRVRQASAPRISSC